MGFPNVNQLFPHFFACCWTISGTQSVEPCCRLNGCQSSTAAEPLSRQSLMMDESGSFFFLNTGRPVRAAWGGIGWWLAVHGWQLVDIQWWCMATSSDGQIAVAGRPGLS